MYRQLVVLIIGISLCSILPEITAIACPQNEVSSLLTTRNLPTCGNKRLSGEWIFGDRCICAREWLVRNDEGGCVPVWTCPDICPPNQEFAHCSTGFKPSNKFYGLTAIEMLEKCKPACSCKKNYLWSPKRRQCIYALFRT